MPVEVVVSPLEFYIVSSLWSENSNSNIILKCDSIVADDQDLNEIKTCYLFVITLLAAYLRKKLFDYFCS